MVDKAAGIQMSVMDRFTGGSMTQFVINRIECKIYFSSDAFAHELEYGAKTGEAKFKCKANLY